jgi:PhnB protein
MAKSRTPVRKAAPARRRAPKSAAKKATATRQAARKQAPARRKVSPVPPGYRSVTPYLVCRNTAQAIEFYKKAFGARLKVKMDGPGGGVVHAEMQFGDSMVMLGDEMPAMGATAPETIGGTASGVFIYAENVDRAYARAVAAGATSEQAPQDMFWGDRYCKLADPFGHKWAIGTHIEDVSPKEIARRGREAMALIPSDLPS